MGYDIGFVKVIVEDLEKETAFYRAVLGLEQLERIQVDDDQFAVDEIALGTGSPTGCALVLVKDFRGDVPVTKSGLLGFNTQDLDALVERVRANGGTVQLEPFDYEGERAAVVVDPEGQMLEIIEVAD